MNYNLQRGGGTIQTEPNGYARIVTKYYFNKHKVWDRDKADAKRRILVPNNEQHGGVYTCTN